MSKLLAMTNKRPIKLEADSACDSPGSDAIRHNTIGLKNKETEESPKNPEQKIIKRVIALEGDLIRTMGYKNRYVKVPDGHFWIEGDHHGHSLDSNSFGPVSVGLVHAKASHIIWPPHRWQKIFPHLPPDRAPLLSRNEDLEEEGDE